MRHIWIKIHVWLFRGEHITTYLSKSNIFYKLFFFCDAFKKINGQKMYYNYNWKEKKMGLHSYMFLDIKNKKNIFNNETCPMDAFLKFRCPVRFWSFSLQAWLLCCGCARQLRNAVQKWKHRTYFNDIAQHSPSAKIWHKEAKINAFLQLFKF